MSRHCTETDLGPELEAHLLAEAACARGRPSAFLDGAGENGDGWRTLVALEPEIVLWWRNAKQGSGAAALGSVARMARERRRKGGPAGTGLVTLLGFDLLEPETGAVREDDDLPDMVVLAVDASVRFPRDGRAVLCATEEASRSGAAEGRLRRAIGRVGHASPAEVPQAPAVGPLRARTSLPREEYLQAVRTVKRHIREGDIYQANLTQRFAVECREEPFEVYRRLSEAAPAPRSALVMADDLAVASVSPETFLRCAPDGSVETRPIKGTRPRGRTDQEDDELARELKTSPKDGAELLMIVDLERNDLGRVCRTGSVHVPELATLVTFPAVHHLVARVEGVLRPDVGPEELIRATFPGGSVTGAPKIRALEILRGLEPVRRNFYTGCLVWLGDDGSLDSSILIRTVVLSRRTAFLGAGGGVVADSEAEEEWREANHKARPLARALGFEPEAAI